MQAVEKNGPEFVHALHRRSDRDELHQVAELSQIRGDAGQSAIPLVLRFLFEPVDGGVAAVDDELGDAADLSAREHLEAARDPADEPQRVDAVADHDVPRAVSLLRQAIDLVARKPRHQHRHRPFLSQSMRTAGASRNTRPHRADPYRRVHRPIE